MRSSVLLFILILSTLSLSAQNAIIIKSPNDIPINDPKPKIFLGGSIDMGNVENWQAQIERQLADMNVILLNPRRDHWDKTWKPISSDPNFKEQVEWELMALEEADMIIMYFAPHSQSPISLLELGLYAKTDKLMVVCPEGYWRKGNVDILAETYNIPMYEDLNQLITALKTRVKN